MIRKFGPISQFGDFRSTKRLYCTIHSFQGVVPDQHTFSHGRITELPFLDSKLVRQVKELV